MTSWQGRSRGMSSISHVLWVMRLQLPQATCYKCLLLPFHVRATFKICLCDLCRAMSWPLPQPSNTACRTSLSALTALSQTASASHVRRTRPCPSASLVLEAGVTAAWAPTLLSCRSVAAELGLYRAVSSAVCIANCCNQCWGSGKGALGTSHGAPGFQLKSGWQVQQMHEMHTEHGAVQLHGSQGQYG